MKVLINKTHGLANSMLVEIPVQEIEDVLMEVPRWKELNRGEGMVRWRGENEFKRTEAGLKDLKIPLEDQIKDLGLVDDQSGPRHRIITVGNRNLGNNYGVVAWHSQKQPRLFHLKDEPIEQRSYSCLIRHSEGRLSIQSLCFSEDHVLTVDRKTDLTQEVVWCTYGQQILKAGKITNIEDIIHEFYDIRHIFALDPFRPDGKSLLAEIYGYSPGNEKADFNFEQFKRNVLEKWKAGIARSRYLHNCVGLSEENVFILQQEGTPEEVAMSLKEAGAQDAVILDNGGSVGCWTWWPYRKEDGQKVAGGFIFTAPDFRPPATSIIAFKLRGPVRTNMPAGSASVTVL